MTTVDPLVLPLKPIMMPNMVNWWPPAIGWWCVLASILILCLLILIIFIYYHRKKNKLKYRAIASLNYDYQRYLKHQNKGLYVQDLSYTLRQIAVQRYPRDVRHQDALIENIMQSLRPAPYLPPEQCDSIVVDALLPKILKWAKTL